jgi:hypothetical protein
VSPTATTEATANTVVTASAITFNGSIIADITFFAPAGRPDTGAANRTMDFWLYQDGTSIGLLGRLTTPATGAHDTVVYAVRRMTPAAGSRTYSIRASVSAGTGLITAGAGGAGAAMPGFIRITRAL